MDLNPKIIFEDDFFLAIDKPAGVIVNDSASAGDAPTIQTWAENYLFPDKESRKMFEKSGATSLFYERKGIVHRLDKETSGVLLIAKNEVVFERLQQSFKNHEIHKKYVALVHGLTLKEGLLNFDIVRHGKKGKFVVCPGGKNSLTEYKLLKNYKFNEESLNDFEKKNFDRLKVKYDLLNFSFLEIQIFTGRTHQIRVHFSYIKHPVCGDELYSWHKTINFERLWCPRQFLHAKEVEMMHPVTHEKILIKSELPEDLTNIIRTYMTDRTN